MSLLSIFFTYFTLPILALMLTVDSFDMNRKYKKLYQNDVVTAFNIRIKKVNVSLLLAISALILFFTILTVNTLIYLSILNISISEFYLVSAWEFLIIIALFATYIMLNDTGTKKK